MYITMPLCEKWNGFEICKIAVFYLWLSLPGHYRVTDEALLAETM